MYAVMFCPGSRGKRLIFATFYRNLGLRTQQHLRNGSEKGKSNQTDLRFVEGGEGEDSVTIPKYYNPKQNGSRGFGER